MTPELQLIIHDGKSAAGESPLVVRVNPDPGKSFMIGRSPEAQATIDDVSVAFEHAVIRAIDQGYTIENLASGGTWLNGARLGQTPLPIRAGDEVRLSDAVWLSVVGNDGAPVRPASALPLVGGAFLLTIALGAWILLSDGSAAAAPNYVAAFSRLESWLDRKARVGAVPDRLLQDFRDAWRLEKAGKHADAEKLWARVAIESGVCEADDGGGKRRPWSEWAGQIKRPLDPFLLDPAQTDRGEVGDADYGAAILEFARDSAAFNAKKAAQGND